MNANHGIALGAATFATFYVFTLGFQVSKYRKLAKVPYPYMSCTKAEVDADGTGNKHKFNCAQRVHHNTLESLPLILTWFVCCAVHYPIVASASIGIWVLGRMAYSRGYITGEPAKRNQGAFGYIGSLGLLVGSLLSAYKTYAQ